MDRLVANETDSAAAIESYGLAVVGSWLGAVDQGQVEARRKSAVTLAHDANRAEVAWLDGLAAVARRDRRSLAEARAALRATGGPSVNALDRLLAAFDASLAGATGAAGTAMANLGGPRSGAISS